MGWEVALVAVSTGVKVISALSQGESEARATERASTFQLEKARLEAEQFEIQAEQARLEGQIQTTERQRELNEVSSFNRALARFDAASSPSFLAIRTENERAAERDQLIFQGNAASRRAALLQSSLQTRRGALETVGAGAESAASSRRSGRLSALGSLAQGGIRLRQLS